MAGGAYQGRQACKLPPALDKGAEIVIICLKTPRSIGAVKWLSQEGFTNARQLQGGMLAWRSAGLPEVLKELS